jgi:hypothetical protein
MRRSRGRGYTVVELMMALAVFTTGVTGVIAMQRTVIAGNRHARNLTVANGIAQAWLDQLAADSSLWQTDLAQTVWLQSIQTPGMDGAWQLPPQSAPAARNFGPTFNLFGQPTAGANDYCAHIRLTWLDQGTNTGAIRTEVRVFWLRDGGARIAGDCNNPAAGTVANVGANAQNAYFFVYHTGAVAQRP